MVDEILKEMSPNFSKLYSRRGASVDCAGALLKIVAVADLLFGSSERMLIEQLQYNLLFRWFVGMEMDEAVLESRGVQQESVVQFPKIATSLQILVHLLRIGRSGLIRWYALLPGKCKG